jgi:nucleoside-diphosphate-sugar epimerase
MKKILVTGGSGFMGLNRCNFLAANGDEVKCIDLFRHPHLLPGVVFQKTDILDSSALNQEVEKFSPSIIMIEFDSKAIISGMRRLQCCLRCHPSKHMM